MSDEMRESTIPEFSAEDARYLAEREAELEAAGGRGVDVAEEIDTLRQERDFVTLTLVVRRDAAEAFEREGVAHFASDEIMFWAGEKGVTDEALSAGADPAMWA